MGVVSNPIIRILAEIKEEHQALTTLMASLTPTQITKDLPGLGTAVDVLNHITAWQANALRIAKMQAAPDAPEFEPDQSSSQILGLDVDQFNAELRASHQDWTLDQALAWHNQVHTDLLTTLATLPPARLLGGSGPYGARRWYVRPAITHSREHRLELERLLAAS
jgi:hypothetical protein